MWDRLTPGAQDSILRTNEIAVQYKSQWVSTEHLLLGLLHEDKYTYATSPGQLKVILRTDNFDLDSPAIRVLVALGVNLRQMKDELISSLIPINENGETVENLQLSQRGKHVIDLAYDEAMSLMAKSIGTEHILLGLIREYDGLAAQVLRKAGLNLEGVRGAIERN